MENKKQITDNKPSSWSDIAYAAIQFAKIYFGIMVFILLLTVPTKGVWILVNWLWNMI